VKLLFHPSLLCLPVQESEITSHTTIESVGVRFS
jgi:hypothetical protein